MCHFVHRMFICLGLNKNKESVTIGIRFVRKDRFTDMGLIQKVFGTHSERELKRIMPLVDRIEELRSSMMELSDDELREKTNEYKKRVQQDGESLDSVLPEAFATVREARLKDGALQGAADWRDRHASGTYRRDAYR